MEGDWLNRDTAAKIYHVRTASGGKVSLAASQVRELIRQQPAEQQYFELAPTYEDTVDGHWQASEWCRQRGLTLLREHHLRRLIELDPRQHRAWIGLGYVQIDGRWQKPVDAQRNKGYYYDRGRWRLAQEIELLEQREASDAARLAWRQRLHKLRQTLAQPTQVERAIAANREWRDIRDSAAVPALITYLQTDPSPAIRVMSAETLDQIGDDAALNALLRASLYEPHLEVWHVVADRLAKRASPGLVSAYIRQLKAPNPTVVHRASHMLGRLGDKSAVSPLIDVLVGTFPIALNRSSADAINATFTPDGKDNPLGPSTGISKSGGPQVLWQRLPNEEALNSLVKLTGGATYNYDQQAWRHWLAAQPPDNPYQTGRRSQ